MASMSDLDRTVREVEALGRKAIGMQTDVTREEDCRRMTEAVLETFGKIDILCSNAGVFTFGKAWELTEAEWDLVMAVNLKGAWLVTKSVAPHMMERRYGKIIITSSRDGLRVEPNYAHYNASKSGVIAYMKSLAIELGPYDINVNAICPTQMGRRVDDLEQRMRGGYAAMVVGHANPTAGEFYAASAQENLFEIYPDFPEVAEGVLWLASDRSHLVTGLALPMDAGWIVKRGG
jgi:NAD(P)-dependent dehydrogenase (short-subunit alcohol dehydrogenase family)